MKKAFIPVVALLFFSAAASAQLKEPQKPASTASVKTVTRKPVTTTAGVSPVKKTTAPAASKTKTVTKPTGIKRKHPRKARKSKAKAKKM
ncbi:MAG: hypothetical protein ABIT05_03930 [Chitinophagaceae bacterium]